MPADDAAKLSPPSVDLNTASEVVPTNKFVELLGSKRTDCAANAAVPPMPNSQLVPPLVVRLMPAPSVETRIVCESFGSTAISVTTSSGHVSSESGVQVTPRSGDV